MDFKKYENYSKAGKSSIKKYLYLFLQKQKTKKFEDTLGLSEKKEQNDLDDNDLFFMEENIFNKTFNHKSSDKSNDRKIKKFNIKSVCSSLNKNRNSDSEFSELRDDIINNNLNKRYDKFKYHLLHHNDNFDKIFNRSQYGPSSSQYKPKYEFTYKKLIYSVPFKKLTGRKSKLFPEEIKDIYKKDIDSKRDLYHSSSEKNSLSNLEIFNKTAKKDNNVANKAENSPKKVIVNINTKRNRTDSINSNKSNNFIFTNNELNYIKKKIHLEKKEKQIQQNKKEKSQEKENNNIKSYINKEKEKKFSNQTLQSHLDSSLLMNNKLLNHISSELFSLNKYNLKNKKNTEIIIFSNEDNIINNNDINKKNIMPQSQKLKGINFKQMLSREYLNKINALKEPMHPMVTPNYAPVEPKTIMKVLYSKSNKNEEKKKIIAYNNDFTYDINNVYNNYNNHHSPKKFNFGKMCGRFEDEKNMLPSFMLRSYDRNSIEFLSQSSLKSNNYANRPFQDIESSFKIKQTFNRRLKLDELKNENKIMEFNKNYLKKISNQNLRYIDEKKRKKDDSNIMSRSSWWKNKLGEFYQKDYDEIFKNFSASFLGTKVDGITFKSYDNKSRFKNLLSKSDKELFSPIY